MFTSYADLQKSVDATPPRTCITVWSEYQMPLRGQVDEAFLALASEQMPEGGEWLLIGLDRVDCGVASWYRCASGTSLAELIAEMPDYMGERIALGIHPAWSENGGIEVSAVVPDADGTVTTGVY